ncbi:MAG: oxygenase MpaB family protein [Gemmatimonadales bacterium]
MTEGHSTSHRPEGGNARGDPGLYGPDSVTWRLHADPSTMALGGLRALMLQALHPLAMAGVAQHSEYRTDPWGRLFRTTKYVATMIYDTTAEAERAAARVRAVHGRLSGIEPESGTAYRVDDPALLLWVHCAEVDSFLAAYLRCGGRLRPSQADAYIAEQVRGAVLVGVDPRSCPVSLDGLRAYFEAVRPELRATAEARAALRFLLWPPPPPQAKPAWRPAWTALSLTAFGLLPAWARACFGICGLVLASPGTGLAATLGARSLRAIVPLLPDDVRVSPARRAAMARIAGA